MRYRFEIAGYISNVDSADQADSIVGDIIDDAENIDGVTIHYDFLEEEEDDEDYLDND